MMCCPIDNSGQAQARVMPTVASAQLHCGRGEYFRMCTPPLCRQNRIADETTHLAILAYPVMPHFDTIKRSRIGA